MIKNAVIAVLISCVSAFVSPNLTSESAQLNHADAAISMPLSSSNTRFSPDPSWSSVPKNLSWPKKATSAADALISQLETQIQTELLNAKASGASYVTVNKVSETAAFPYIGALPEYRSENSAFYFESHGSKWTAMKPVRVLPKLTFNIANYLVRPKNSRCDLQGLTKSNLRSWIAHNCPIARPLATDFLRANMIFWLHQAPPASVFRAQRGALEDLAASHEIYSVSLGHMHSSTIDQTFSGGLPLIGKSNGYSYEIQLGKADFDFVFRQENPSYQLMATHTKLVIPNTGDSYIAAVFP